MENNIPIQEMINFYEKRTKNHILRVKKNILKYIKTINTGYDKSEMFKRSKNHDSSKYSDEEYIPYVWLSWQKKEENEGRIFKLNSDIERDISIAWNHHKSTNRHHPEYHNTPKDMNNEDLIEMVCDWAAMSQEFNNSLELWINKHVTKKDYTDEQIKLINSIGVIVK